MQKYLGVSTLLFSSPHQKSSREIPYKFTKNIREKVKKIGIPISLQIRKQKNQNTNKQSIRGNIEFGISLTLSRCIVFESREKQRIGSKFRLLRKREDETDKAPGAT